MTRLALVMCSLAVLATAGCGRKSSKKTPDVAGIAAVPASAQVVIAANVARVVDSPLVARAVDQLLMRDAELATRWQKLRESCKLDVDRVSSIVLAIGKHEGAQPGTGPVLMVATGKLVEAELASCVRGMVGQGGGTLTAKPVGGRTLYQAKDGNRTVYFAFGRPDTVVLGSNEAFVVDALGTGPKVRDNAELSKWLDKVDQNAPVWAVGKVDERVRGGLVKVTGGQLREGPQALFVAVDPTAGAKLAVGAVMATPADAKTLESFAKNQLALMAMASQAKSLGKIVDKLAISAEAEVVRFSVNLDATEVNLLISALDGEGAAEQDSPPAPAPAPDAGSAPGP